MSDPRYPGVTDAEGAHAADNGYDGGYDSRAADSSRSRYGSDPYGQPASTSAGPTGSASSASSANSAGPVDGGGGSRGSGGSAGYADQGYSNNSRSSRSDSGGRSSYGGDYNDAGGRGYSGGSHSAAGGSHAAGGSGYPSQGYSPPTTYDTSGRRGGGYDGAKTTYDTTGGKTTYDTTGAKTTYDTSGGRSTYDTRGNAAAGAGGAGGAGGYSSPAARMASAMRRSVASAARGPRGPRRARLQLKHIDPWSTLKLSLVLAVALFVVWMVAIGLLYGVLDGMGVFDKINGLYEDVTGKSGEDLIGPGLVLGVAALIGAINIVLFTALATVGSFVYNMCADLVGGVEITLSEHD